MFPSGISYVICLAGLKGELRCSSSSRRLDEDHLNLVLQVLDLGVQLGTWEPSQLLLVRADARIPGASLPADARLRGDPARQAGGVGKSVRGLGSESLSPNHRAEKEAVPRNRSLAWVRKLSRTLLRRDGAGDDGARDAAGAAKGGLGLDKDVRHVLVLGA